MPRDASGNYTLPVGNPVVTGTTITSTWANSTMNDMKIAMQDSLSRSGNGPMLAPLKNVSGTAAAPGITFNLESSTGWYRAGPGDVRYSINGIDKYRFFADQIQVWSVADSAWYPIPTAKTTGSVTETVTLAASQTVVPFTSSVAGAALYVNGTSGDRGRLFLGTDYTYDPVANEITLASSYPAGTLIASVLNDETDVAAAAAAASDSASSAEGFAQAASDLYDDFDRRYLGPKSTAPSVDNEGNPLVTGAIYFNTSGGSMFVWEGTAWTNISPILPDFGTAALVDTGTAADEVPLNSDLGSASLVDAIGSGDLYGRDSILGTVSETAGVPTGEIFESYESNGFSVIKYASGDMIMRKTVTRAITTTGPSFSNEFESSIVFPEAFVATPNIVSSQTQPHGDINARCANFGFGNSSNPVSATETGDIGIYTAGVAFTTVAFSCSFIVMGRWF